jgi:hypothetical protein
MNQRRLFLGLFQRRECVVPTWRGLLLFLGVSALALILFVRNVYPFLAVNKPSPGGVLVIEGWATDYSMAQAIEEFHAHPYDAFLVTGGPIDKGAPFTQFKTYAEFGEATIEKMGVSPNLVHAVPAPEVERDRTYASAQALKEWMQAHHLSTKNVNVLTMGWHARRSRLLFERAFGPETTIGITALDIPDPNRKPWWKTSVGVRGVISEVMAYIYARFLFNPNAI